LVSLLPTGFAGDDLGLPSRWIKTLLPKHAHLHSVDEASGALAIQRPAEGSTLTGSKRQINKGQEESEEEEGATGKSTAAHG
jgi:hypothetical protein